MYRRKGHGWRNFIVGVAIGAGAATGVTMNYDTIEKNVSELAQSVQAMDILPGTPEYKGEWVLYRISENDGKSPVWKISKDCQRKKDGSSSDWRDQIMMYNKNRGRKMDILHVGDTIFVPQDCLDIKEPYRK